MATWFVDGDGTYWRLSKFAGGIQAETPEGKWGQAIPLQTAVEQFEVSQLPLEVGLVLDEFDRVKVQQISQDDYRTLRQKVVEVVKYIREQKAAPKVIESKPEVNDVKEGE
jgi:hypothetical protein